MRFKKTVFFILAVLAGLPLAAQDSTAAWKKSGSAGLNFSQVQLSDWAAGGDNAVALSSLLILSANYKGGPAAWDNALELGYGLTRLSGDPVRKSDDKIVLTSKFGRAVVGKWSASGLVDFRTQFAAGYDYGAEPKKRLSGFMAPGYAVLALGAEYKSGDPFSLLLSPVTGKMTFVLDDSLSDAGAFVGTPGKKTKTELGWFINSALKIKPMENVELSTKLNLFSNYEKLSNVDVIWEGLALMKVNQWISASFTAQFIEDDNVRDEKGKIRRQFKELFAMGLLYQF
ncbi:DUF3078 domain-containing protein [bacterium]|nr:DUF3078 domain-containing protein [bacterium]